MPGPLDTHNLAQALLDNAVLALDTLPSFDATLEGAPDRQFVSPGLPVDDFVGSDCCSQIACWVSPVTESGTTPATRRSERNAWINQVALTVGVTRCIPTGTSSTVGIYTPPSDDELTEAARQHNADGWVLWNYLHEAVHSEQLLTLCDAVAFDGFIDRIPQGGCSGWQGIIRATLGGYPVEISS